MASRANVLPSYPYGADSARKRRPVVFQTYDPVVLPRSRSWDLNGGLLAAAAAATLLIAGATYAVYYTEPARLAETPAAALEREYVPDADLSRMNALKALSGPAVVAPSAAPAETMSVPARGSGSSEVRIDDSAPGVQESLPQPLETQPSTAPYPDPTITVPDAIAPVEEPAPSFENENPYR